MNKEIEEMAQELENAKIKAQGTIGSLNKGFGNWYATELYNAGYRKQVWHKFENEKPNNNSTVLVYYIGLYDNAKITDVFTFVDGAFIGLWNADIIAWIELPEYEGENE